MPQQAPLCRTEMENLIKILDDYRDMMIFLQAKAPDFPGSNMINVTLTEVARLTRRLHVLVSQLP